MNFGNSDVDQLDALRTQGWKSHEQSGHIGHIGPLLSKRNASGQWGYALLMDAQHLNPAGVVHGGVILSLADHAASAVAWEQTGRQACVTVQLDSHFIAPARCGDLLLADVHVLEQTSSMVFVRVDVMVQERRIAAVQAILKVLRTAIPTAS